MPKVGFAEKARGYTTAQLIAACTTVGVFLVMRNNAVPTALILSELITSLLLLIGTRRYLRRSRERRQCHMSTIVIPMTVVVPFVVERISRSMFLEGLPLEAVTLCAIRNLTCLPFLKPNDARYQCAGVAVSLLAVFSIYLLDHGTATSIVVFSYCVLSIYWLTRWHWMKLHFRSPSRVEREIPRSARLGIVGLTLACALFFLLSMRATTTTTAIAGFMPSSGGNRRSDPNAFGGIGDGHHMVRATDSAKSLGPLESELFLESTMPSIYDVFNDLYQEPTNRKKETSRAIPLAPNDVNSNHDRLAHNELASREFPAARRKLRRDKERSMNDVRSRALFYIKGRVPIHLGHERYNSWNGSVLSYRGDARRPELTLVGLEQVPWVICASCPDMRTARGTETHVIQMAHLATDRVPSPPQLYALNFDKLHTAKFFRWTDDGALSFAGGNIPGMTVLHARSTPRRRKDVEAVRLLRDESHDRPQLNPDIEESLRRWTARATTDWEYVEGVIAGIQKTCQLDPSSSIEETEDDIVNEFLLVERRGPDYHFAITAAILLRDLGFRTHVVSGFYARPENYDRASGGTAVYADDVHFWVEVQARDLSWVTVEPSPGYEVQYARVTLWERLGQWSCQVLATLWSRRFTLLLCASCAVVLARLHRRIYVWALVCCWLLPLPRTDRAVVRAALSVLDAYAHLQGRQRSPNLTVEDWLQNLHRNCETAIPQWVEFRRLVQWSLYAGTEFAAASDDPRRVCCDILNHYRSVGYGTTPNEEQSNDEGSRENL